MAPGAARRYGMPVEPRPWGRQVMRMRSPQVAATMAALLASTAFVVGPAHAARAASPTVIKFDDLAIGTVVSNQYSSQGVEFGLASGFGQSPTNADCGSPSVSSIATAYSSPNYAVLPDCSPPGAVARYFADTYGYFSNGATSSLSVEVSSLAASGAAVAMTIYGYDAGGTEVATGTATAPAGTWTALTASPTGSSASISYFQIISTTSVSDAALAPQVGIDDLSFTTTGGGGGSPTASVAVDTTDPTGGQPVTFDGSGSTPGGASGSTIVSYDWDFNDDGHIDTSTGSNPNATFIFPPGTHTIGLTITNSGGQSASTHTTFTAAPPPISLPMSDGGQGDCTSTYDDGDVHIIADCIQTLPQGGWVIQTKVLDLDGMALVPRGGGYGVFTISKFNQLGIGSGTRLSGPVTDVELLNTPIGNVVVGGMDLSTNPMQLTFKAFVPPVIHLGGAIRSADRAPATHRGAFDDENGGKTLLASFGVGESCSSAGKNPACCPPSGGSSACATLPGGFPLTGQVKVYLNNKGQSLFDVQVALDLQSVGFEATGSLEIVADPTTGINLASLQFTIPKAGIADIFQVKDASFVYYFPSDPDASKRDTWQAKGTLIFGPLSQPSLAAELDFKQGQFSYASMLFTAPTGTGVPIYPGILLNQLGGSIGVNPLQFGGQLGASIAEELELSLAFKYRDATDTTLGLFGGKGSLSLSDDEIASLAADVYSDGYTDAQLKLSLKYPSDDPVVSASGGISFWDEPSSGRWEADGNVALKLWVISAEVAGLINNNYIAGCADISGFGAQGRYGFADGSISGGFFGFSNCSDQLKQYQQTPVAQHTGGFVGSERGFHGSVTSAAGTKYQTIHIAGGQQGVELKLTANADDPTVTLISPSGQKFTTPTAAGEVSKAKGKYVAAIAPDTHQIIVFLRKPQGGTWKVVEAAGAPKVTQVHQAGDAPPAKIHTHVKRLHGRRYQLRYRIAHYVAGSQIQFVERGHDSTDVVGTARRAHGTVTFTPQDALGRKRSIVAYLRSSAGAPLRTLKVGSFKAPPAVRPSGVHHVRMVRTGGSGARLTWAAAHHVRRYRVTLRGNDGRLVTTFTSPKHRSVTLGKVLPSDSYTATVVGQGGPNLLSGRAGRAHLRAIKPAKVDFLSCKSHTCSLTVSTVGSGQVTVTGREVHATLRRGKKVFGSGLASALTHPKRITLNQRHALHKGRYHLVLTYTHAGHRHTGHETVTVH